MHAAAMHAAADFDDELLAAVGVMMIAMPRRVRRWRGIAAVATLTTATFVTAALVAAGRGFHSMHMRNGAKRGEALVIGVRALDFLAIPDRTRGGGKR